MRNKHMCICSMLLCYVFQTIDPNNKLLTEFIFCHVQTCAIYLLNITDSCIKRDRRRGKRRRENIFLFHVHLFYAAHYQLSIYY